MYIITHNKDLDGHASGAICKRKYPDAKLIGWDYKDPIPKVDWEDDIILIDISFPMDMMNSIAATAKSFTWIDHHVSAWKEWQLWMDKNDESSMFLGDINYVYTLGKAACEIGWEYLFPDEPVPLAVTLMGRYDTWRQGEGDWEGETLPFKYYMYGQCNSAENFPENIFDASNPSIYSRIESGKDIMKYQRMMDEATTRAYSFEREAYGLRAICINQPYFSSETVATAYDPDKHDIMIGFAWGGDNCRVSLRSAKDEVDVSVIAKSKGGGGHKGAAGFEVKTFEEIWTSSKNIQ